MQWAVAPEGTSTSQAEQQCRAQYRPLAEVLATAGILGSVDRRPLFRTIRVSTVSTAR